MNFALQVPMDTSPQVPNSVCPSTGRGVMMMAVPSSGSTSGSGMANGTHSSSSPNSLSVTASQPASRSDACVGTCSASTMTEPECLGPCEPGTAVTLEGIVWHETEGGKAKFPFYDNKSRTFIQRDYIPIL